MTYNIALNFEDGVTRFVACNEGETVLDAAYRSQINLPMDCSDGVCGTCKCACYQGEFDMGEEFLDEALSDEEAEQGMVLTCQMVPSSDCVIEVPLASTMCKTGHVEFEGTVSEVELISPTSIELRITADKGVDFLPGQYVNIHIPGTKESRSYSFSSKPGSSDISFLIRNIPGGVMSSWLVGKARTGDRITLTGPMGSFYLRPVERPVLMLAGGTGLAPLLAALEHMKTNAVEHPTHLVYGVSSDDDLVCLADLDRFVEELADFSYVTCISGEESKHPRKGYVMHHIDDARINAGDVDVYLCGPPPMVDSVMRFFKEKGVKPNSFHYEKFLPGVSKAEESVA